MASADVGQVAQWVKERRCRAEAARRPPFSGGAGIYPHTAGHYREAERLLTEQVFRDRPGSTTTRSFEETVVAAQVHATLALAAATALGRSDLDSREWRKIAGTVDGG